MSNLENVDFEEATRRLESLLHPGYGYISLLAARRCFPKDLFADGLAALIELGCFNGKIFCKMQTPPGAWEVLTISGAGSSGLSCETKIVMNPPYNFEAIQEEQLKLTQDWHILTL